MLGSDLLLRDAHKDVIRTEKKIIIFPSYCQGNECPLLEHIFNLRLRVHFSPCNYYNVSYKTFIQEGEHFSRLLNRKRKKKEE